jgi:hypothetical protein
MDVKVYLLECTDIIARHLNPFSMCDRVRAAAAPSRMAHSKASNRAA